MSSSNEIVVNDDFADIFSELRRSTVWEPIRPAPPMTTSFLSLNFHQTCLS